MTTTDLQVTPYPVATLRTYHQNPRRGDVKAIALSLKMNGQYRPIVVNRGTHTGRPDEVLAGNHTLMAARDLGWDTIQAVTVDVDDDQARRIVLADNRTADLGDYNPEVLAEILAMVDNPDGTGYSASDIEEITSALHEDTDIDTDPDAAPDAPIDPTSQPGDLWTLGKHRLLVGDSTDPKALTTLMAGELAACLWTDPPYGVNYVGKTKDALTIDNDGADSMVTVVRRAIPNSIRHLAPGAAIYIAHSENQRTIIEQILTEQGCPLRQCLVWVKNRLILGHLDYQQQHEPILQADAPNTHDEDEPQEETIRTHQHIAYAHTEQEHGRYGRGGSGWYGDNAQTTVFDIPAPAASRLHPTMKPVALIRPMIDNSTRRGDIVLDPFGGSGSTLIAAHMAGRRARLIEKDPKYADVICRRYQEATGQIPIRDGQQVDFMGGESAIG